MSETVRELFERAWQARSENRPADARRDMAEAVKLCREGDSSVDLGVDLARALTGLGQMERDLQHREVARRHYEEAAAIYRAEGPALKLAHTIRHVGDIHRNEGHPELAEPCYHEAIGLYRRDARTPPLDLANAIRGLAILKHAAGENEQAKLLWEEARELYTATGVEAGVAECNRRLTLLEESKGPAE